jgi:hypothetical protein
MVRIVTPIPAGDADVANIRFGKSPLPGSGKTRVELTVGGAIRVITVGATPVTDNPATPAINEVDGDVTRAKIQITESALPFGEVQAGRPVILPMDRSMNRHRRANHWSMAVRVHPRILAGSNSHEYASHVL